MVKGLDLFRDKFADFYEQYVLIGGTAAYLLLDEADLQPRATKDLDIVLCVEALEPAFGEVFWEFVQAGGYQNRRRSSDEPVFYRFDKPTDQGYPAMMELFSRELAGLKLGSDSELTPIPIGEEVASLSAILLDADYYQFLHTHKRTIAGLSLASELSLIPFKARAWLDLTKRKADGQPIDGRDIKKHRNDVFRLYQLLSPTQRITTPAIVEADLAAFLEAVENESDDQALKNLGIRGLTVREVVGTLRAVYRVG